MRKIRVLLFSSLYPSSARPLHGLFVETRLRELVGSGEVEARVVAPVPWFPFPQRRFGSYGLYAATPKRENWRGVQVHHPRYLSLPGIAMVSAPAMMAHSALPTLRALMAEGFDFDLIDAHYYYPDGAAAARLARALCKPFLVTARGTDLNVLPEYAWPRREIVATAEAASASIGVSAALMERLALLGADRSRLHVLRNGVDLQRFKPVDRAEARRRIGLPVDATVLLSVGRLVEAKGHHLAIEALRTLPGRPFLVIAGQGEEKEGLARRAAEHGVADRVILAGGVPQEELLWYYGAADALVLCSRREGWANVLLESMACGTPVIATDIEGTREVVGAPEAGCLMAERSAAALAEAYDRLFERYAGREATRRYAESFSWQATTQGQLALMRAVLDRAAAEPDRDAPGARSADLVRS